MNEAVVLGVVQGLAEWLPVSSEGLLVLVQSRFFGQENLSKAVSMALWLHLGSALAAAVFYKKIVLTLLIRLRGLRGRFWKDPELRFYGIGTGVSMILGILIYLFLYYLGEIDGRWITGFVGGLLLFTAMLLWQGSRVKTKYVARSRVEFQKKDAWWAGLAQGLAVLPGVSRSGGTTSVLLLLGHNKDKVFERSFLLGIPMVLLANIGLALLNKVSVGFDEIVALLVAFVVSLLTIAALTKIAQKINFTVLVLVFGLVTLLAAAIGG